MRVKALVLGSSGFIGSRIVEALNSDSEVKVMTSSRSSGDYQVDMTQRDQVSLLPEDVDVVINAAGAGDIDGLQKDKERWRRVNIEALENLAAKYSSTRFLHISSLAAMGLEGEYTLDKEPDPKLPYSISKRKSERIVSQTFDNFTIIRPGLVYDDRNTSELLRLFSKFGLIPDNGARSISIHVADLADTVSRFVKEERSETLCMAGKSMNISEIAHKSGLSGEVVYVPKPLILTLGYIGQFLREFGFRVPGLVRARSINYDHEWD